MAIAGQCLPSWAVHIEWDDLIHVVYGNFVFHSNQQGCGPVARFSFCEGCAQGLCDRRFVRQCEGVDGSLRDPCEGGSLMPVSQCSQDSTVCGSGGTDLELALPEQQKSSLECVFEGETGACQHF